MGAESHISFTSSEPASPARRDHSDERERRALRPSAGGSGGGGWDRESEPEAGPLPNWDRSEAGLLPNWDRSEYLNLSYQGLGRRAPRRPPPAARRPPPAGCVRHTGPRDPRAPPA